MNTDLNSMLWREVIAPLQRLRTAYRQEYAAAPSEQERLRAHGRLEGIKDALSLLDALMRGS